VALKPIYTVIFGGSKYIADLLLLWLPEPGKIITVTLCGFGGTRLNVEEVGAAAG
jgi:hypothetical protein